MYLGCRDLKWSLHTHRPFVAGHIVSLTSSIFRFLQLFNRDSQALCFLFKFGRLCPCFGGLRMLLWGFSRSQKRIALAYILKKAVLALCAGIRLLDIWLLILWVFIRLDRASKGWFLTGCSNIQYFSLLMVTLTGASWWYCSWDWLILLFIHSVLIDSLHLCICSLYWRDFIHTASMRCHIFLASTGDDFGCLSSSLPLVLRCRVR